MKKITTVILLLLFTSKLFAQDSLNLSEYYPKSKIFAIEILIGSGVVGVRGQNRQPFNKGNDQFLANELKRKIGYSFGFGLIHKLGNRVQLNGRMFLDRKGYVENSDSISITPSLTISPIFSESVKNDYLTVSILPQFILGKRSLVNVGFGGYISSLISSNTRISKSSKTIYAFNNDHRYNRYDFGLSFNLGFSIPLPKHLEFTAQLIANYGLSKISDVMISYNYPAWYNSSYCVLIGMKFFTKNARLKLLQKTIHL